MSETYHHGVRVIEVDSDPRPIRTVPTSVIGVVGTARGLIRTSSHSTHRY